MERETYYQPRLSPEHVVSEALMSEVELTPIRDHPILGEIQQEIIDDYWDEAERRNG